GTSGSPTSNGTNTTTTAPDIKSPPTLAGGTPYTAGVWVNRTVTVTFSCTPGSDETHIASVTPPVQVSAPAQNRTVTGTCTDSAGNSASMTFGTPAARIANELPLPLA